MTISYQGFEQKHVFVIWVIAPLNILHKIFAILILC